MHAKDIVHVDGGKIIFKKTQFTWMELGLQIIIKNTHFTLMEEIFKSMPFTWMEER